MTDARIPEGDIGRQSRRNRYEANYSNFILKDKLYT